MYNNVTCIRHIHTYYFTCIRHIILNVLGAECDSCSNRNSDKKTEVNVLRAEMKHCNDQVEKLTRV